jgi:hypothetical protein
MYVQLVHLWDAQAKHAVIMPDLPPLFEQATPYNSLGALVF